jgi:parallel beta-helix repeat protein
MRTILLGGFASLAFVATAHASTFHVSPAGSDSAVGSQTAPWKTIQKAASSVHAGDTVVIHAGTYTGFSVSAHGTSSAPIAFVGDGTVNIDGAATAERDAVLLDGASYVRIEGLTVSHAARSGIAAIEGDHITITKNRIDSNAKWGVFTAFSEEVVIENNQISNSAEQHGIYTSNSADHPVIRGNTIWGNGMCGIHMNGDISEGGDGVISNAVVENNIIRDNGKLGGSGINGDGVQNAVIRNNLLDGNHASGISLYDIDGGAPSTGNQVINNTVRMASDARWAINIQDGSTGNTLRNNILLHPNTSRGTIDICASCIAGLVSDHNAVVDRFSIDGDMLTLSAWHAQTGQDAASFTSNDSALFKSATDLALKDGSPAIDKGVATGAPMTDLAGTHRPQGAAIDLGAYEHCTGACTGGGGNGSGEGSNTGGGSGSDDGSGGSGGGGGSDDGSGSDYSGPPAAETGDGGGCSTGGSGAGLVVALGFIAVARRRKSAKRG